MATVLKDISNRIITCLADEDAWPAPSEYCPNDQFNHDRTGDSMDLSFRRRSEQTGPVVRPYPGEKERRGGWGLRRGSGFWHELGVAKTRENASPVAMARAAKVTQEYHEQ